MITEIFIGIFFSVIGVIILSILALIWFNWYSRQLKFDDKYNYYISIGIDEELAREKAEWHNT